MLKEHKKKKKKDKGKDHKKDRNKEKNQVPTSGKDYAKARKRRSRSDREAQSAPGRQETSRQSGGGSGFEGSRGNLPRPCSGSFRIVSPFGRHSVPGLPDVMYDNPGIDAETSSGASATAVYGGKVSGVYVLPGYSTVVILNHGVYYTVYGNIASPSVKAGDIVKQGQSLGKLAVDQEDRTTKIHFEVWKNRTKLNPAEWIR